jgi:hypothetical protein
MADDCEDDLTILDNDGLLRRVPNWPNMVKFDSNMNALRPTGLCFSDKETGDIEVSTTLESSFLEAGCKYEDAIAAFPAFGVARLEVGVVRHVVIPAQKLKRDPTKEDKHHVLVIGEKNKQAKKMMAKAAKLIICPKLP